MRRDCNPILWRMMRAWSSSGYTARWSQSMGKEGKRRKEKNEGRGKEEGEEKQGKKPLTMTHRKANM